MDWRIAKSGGLGAAALMAASLFLSPALADGVPTRGRVTTPPPQPEARRCTLSANVALASEYVFRGFSQTSEGAAIQGGFDATCGLFYAGLWASNLDWGPVTSFDGSTVSTWASIEVDLYAGLKGKHGRFGWDLGAIWYTYPNSTQNPFGTPFDDFRNEYVELKAGATADLWKDGTLGVTGFYSPDYQYETGTVWTLEVGFAQALPTYWGFTPTISALYGHQWGNDSGYFARIAGDDEYSYWNAGVTLGFLEKWAVDLRYWDTDLDDDGFCSGRYFQCDERFVASLKFTY